MTKPFRTVGKYDVHEICPCGGHWFGPLHTNPSLQCDICYPPRLASFNACTEPGCVSPSYHRAHCLDNLL